MGGQMYDAWDCAESSWLNGARRDEADAVLCETRRLCDEAADEAIAPGG